MKEIKIQWQLDEEEKSSKFTTFYRLEGKNIEIRTINSDGMHVSNEIIKLNDAKEAWKSLIKINRYMKEINNCYE